MSIEKIVYPKQELIEDIEQKPELDADKEEDLTVEQLSPENNLPKPFIKEKKDTLVSLLPTQPKVSSSQSSSTKDSSTILKEPEELETTTVLSNSVETKTEKPEENNKTEKIEDSDLLFWLQSF